MKAALLKRIEVLDQQNPDWLRVCSLMRPTKFPSDGQWRPPDRGQRGDPCGVH
jgi:hypothetical protein